jgi:DNA polymerase-3 subunit gamma/tau
VASQALYRKYRSADFSQVVGQDHVVKTLMNALSTGRTSHAYLFTGPRGVGKTSVARLLARALNCTGDPSGGRPCNDCASCRAAINSSLDIVEIDAASNNGVDDVRELRDKIGLAPSMGAYKVYIIDEVHMLSSGAFNALLKTLEEPPAHAVFILATTESHKLPETIISRTQAFHFRPISNEDIVAHLATIAATEKVAIEADALAMIATASRGGFRDAISLLDQLSAGGEETITLSTVRNLLGYSDTESITTISRALALRDAKAALVTLDGLVTLGIQPSQVIIQLIEQWRLIMLCGSGAQTSNTPAIKELAKAVDAGRAAKILTHLIECSRSGWAQLSLEATLVRLCVTAIPEAMVSGVVPQPTDTNAQESRSKSKDDGVTAGEIIAENSTLAALWPKVLVQLKSHNTSLSALLQMYTADFADDKITIQSRFNFHRDLFNKAANRQAIEAVVEKVYSRPIPVIAVTDEHAAKPKAQAVDPNADLVSSALEILGGEVVD